MSDRDAFLRAIIDAPDDDAPRLVFADWLDERGEHARAEFIRIQCERERSVEIGSFVRSLTDPGHTDREAELMRGNAGRWTAGIDRRLLNGCAWRRGFPDDMKVALAWVDVSLWDRLPVTGMRLFLSGTPAREFNLDWVTRLRRVALAGDIGADSLARLCRLASGGHLRELSVRDLHIIDMPDDWTDALQPLGGLQAVDLSGHALDTGHVRQITQTTRVPGLRVLLLESCRLGDEEAVILAESPALATLVRLELGSNVLTDVGVAALAASPYLAGLARLGVNDNPIGVAGITTLRRRFGNRVTL